MTDYPAVRPRARLGFIIPSSNRMVEPQMQRYAPAGLVPHFMRIGMTGRHDAPLEALMPRIREAASLLKDAKPDIVVFHCTATATAGRADVEREATAEISRLTGKPAISTASAVTAAFDVLDAKRLVFISATKQDRHERKRDSLKESGYEIVVDKAAGLEDSDEICSMPPEFWYDTAMALRQHDRADAFFISGANMSAIEAIEALERDLLKPVVTSNQAALWYALRRLELPDVVPGLGKLFTL